MTGSSDERIGVASMETVPDGYPGTLVTRSDNSSTVRVPEIDLEMKSILPIIRW